jgi:hypothetical protein
MIPTFIAFDEETYPNSPQKVREILDSLEAGNAFVKAKIKEIQALRRGKTLAFIRLPDTRRSNDDHTIIVLT